MSKFYQLVRRLAPLGLGVSLTLGQTAIAAPTGRAEKTRARSSCVSEVSATVPAVPLQSWDNLPAVTDAPLAIEIARLIDSRPRTRELRDRYEPHDRLTFRFNDRNNLGGWAIQGQFLMKIVRHIFPSARVIHGGSMDGVTPLRLTDSTLQPESLPTHFDLSFLKVLNRGPALPSRSDLRVMLGLPANGRIVSVYNAQKQTVPGRAVVRQLFHDPTVGLVILSSQADGGDAAAPTWDLGVPVFTNREWLKLHPRGRPRRALILNQTRQRLPFVHGAADDVVVVGAANVFEPLFAGRRVFVDREAERGEGRAGWQRLIRVALHSGRAFPFVDLESLRMQMLTPSLPPPRTDEPILRPEDERWAMDQLLESLARALAKTVR